MCVCTVRCEVVWVSNINAETQKLSLCLPAVLCSTFMTERIIFLHNPVWAPDCVGGHGIQPQELSSSDWVMGLFVRLGGGQGPGCVCRPSGSAFCLPPARVPALMLKFFCVTSGMSLRTRSSSIGLHVVFLCLRLSDINTP